MDTQKLHQLFEEKGINKIKLGGCDLDGVLRGKYISVEKFFSVIETGLGFCDVIFGWDSSDALYDNGKLTGWHTGYPDTLARIDLSSLRFVPWERGVAFFLLDFYRKDEQPLPVSPRQVLKHVAQRAAALRYSSVMSAEYEYFIFQETSHSVREKEFRHLRPLSPGMFGYSLLRLGTFSDLLHKIIDAMREYDIQIEGLHTETGPGVYETALSYDDVLRAADAAVLFKEGVKELCAQHNLLATFMAKWNQHLPGCGCHVHQSLWDENREINLFYDSDDCQQMSKLMKHYLAGQLKLMPEFTVMMCPTVNSYKRLMPHTWAPVNASWGIENRTTALRVISGKASKATRIEHRLAGADANPYLAMAASLAAGLYGIEHQLELDPPGEINAYRARKDMASQLPRSLEEAIARLRKSQAARELFGEEFVEHYAGTREWEVRQFRQAVTSWELQRYFEII